MSITLTSSETSESIFVSFDKAFKVKVVENPAPHSGCEFSVFYTDGTTLTLSVAESDDEISAKLIRSARGAILASTPEG